MDTLFFLRSYGDFVIALSECQCKQSDRQLRMIASKHLQPLYVAITAMEPVLQLPQIEFVDFGVQYGLLASFTNKHFFSRATTHELKRIRQFFTTIPDRDTLFLEQKKRMLMMQLSTGKRFSFVHNGEENIYESYRRFFGLQIVSSEQTNRILPDAGSLLIFPGSRKQTKRLPVKWVKQLSHEFLAKGMNVQIAGLAHEIAEYSGAKNVITDFTELCKAVVAADAVISSDSLPAHLAFLFRKPLEVHYTKTVNHTWLPPGAVAKQVNHSF